MSVSLTGWIKKRNRFTKEFPDVVRKLVHEDVPSFFRLKLVDETISGERGTMATAQSGDKTVVGVDLGNLKKSHALVSQRGPLTIIAANRSIAPYAQDVASTVFTNTGRDYLRTTQFFYEGEIFTKANKEYLRFIHAISKVASYTYINPLPNA